jgi:hypothetical protein
MFEPYTDWNDCGLVLEALVKSECYVSVCEDGSICSSVDLFSSYKVLCDDEGADFKSAICEAYLSAKGEK